MAFLDVFQRFRRSLPQSFVEGNQVALLVDGGPFFDAYLAAIAEAKRTIFLETYILASDRTGWRVAKALAERAEAGVEVAVCYDGYGSITLDGMLIDYLHLAKVKTLAFRPVSIWKRVWPWHRRNHRKSLVVDSRIGIVGGQNISDDYAAPEDGGRNWRDTGLRVEGPAVAHLEAMFRRIWANYGGAPLETTSVTPPSFPDGHEVRFLGNFARRDRRYIRRAYLLAIMAAERTIRITNAYFVPDRVLRRALIRAARRGVKVEIIVAAATDVRLVLFMARTFYSGLLARGIEIYEWHDRILHAKTAVIDGEWSTVGSSNLDNLSQFTNYEVNAGVLGPRLGKALDAQFELDAARSRRVALDRWKMRSRVQRFLEWFSVLARTWFYGNR